MIAFSKQHQLREELLVLLIQNSQLLKMCFHSEQVGASDGLELLERLFPHTLHRFFYFISKVLSQPNVNTKYLPMICLRPEANM